MTPGPGQDTEVWYHGTGRGADGRAITAEAHDGRPVGVVRHVIRHSPTGMTWGYHGSAPADTARTLLLAALGDQAHCPDCQGTGKVTYDPQAGEEPPASPYDPACSPGEYAETGRKVSDCWNPECDEGYRPVPYQEFKRQHVATWDSEWRISRREILDWLGRQEDREQQLTKPQTDAENEGSGHGSGHDQWAQPPDASPGVPAETGSTLDGGCRQQNAKATPDAPDREAGT